MQNHDGYSIDKTTVQPTLGTGKDSLEHKRQHWHGARNRPSCTPISALAADVVVAAIGVAMGLLWLLPPPQ